MRRHTIGALIGSLIFLAACTAPEPSKIPVARGDYDSLPGARWVLSLYAEPYQRSGSSYEFYLLFDVGDGQYPEPGTSRAQRFSEDLFQEHIEIGIFACSTIDRNFAGLDNQFQPYPFFDYFFDCE